MKQPMLSDLTHRGGAVRSLRTHDDAKAVAAALLTKLRERIAKANAVAPLRPAHRQMVYDLNKARAASEKTCVASVAAVVSNPETPDEAVLDLVAGWIGDVLDLRPSLRNATFRDETRRQNKADLAQIDHETAPDDDAALERSIELTTQSLLTTLCYRQTLAARRESRQRSNVLPFRRAVRS